MEVTRLRGLAFSRQFPNAAEPIRGSFVAEQLAATADAVDWRVVAPLQWPPRRGTGAVPGYRDHFGMPVAQPRYAVLPRRLLFTSVGPAMARASRQAFDEAVREGVDFVHAHELYPSGWAAASLASRAGIPLVVTVHGSDLYTNLGHPAWRRLLEQTAEQADRLIAVSTSVAEDLHAALPATRGRVTVVPDTYDAERFRFIDRPARPSGAPVQLLTVGRLSAEKGATVLVDALARLRAAGVDAELTIVGDGAEREHIARGIDAAGLGSAVTLAGRLTGDALAAAYAAADAYVQPSLREGFGVALVEALATGLPVVASDAGGPRDYVTADNGLLVPPGDAEALAEAIAALVDDLDRFDRPRIAATTRAAFGPEAVAARLVKVYRELVEGSARA